MSDIICPFCGKTNPSDAEFCWSCQARLTPASGSGLPQDSSAEDIANWLAETGSQQDKSRENQSAPENEPEWLARIHERMKWEKEQAQQVQDLIPKGEAPIPNEIPDWLKDSAPAPEKMVPEQTANEAVKGAAEDSPRPEVLPVQEDSVSETTPEEDHQETMPPINLNDLFRGDTQDQAAAAEESENTSFRPPRITGELSGYVKPFHTGEIKELLGEDEVTSNETSPAPEDASPPLEKTTGESSDVAGSDQKGEESARLEETADEPELPDWIKELGAEVPSEPAGDTTPPGPAEQEPTFSFTDLGTEKSIAKTEPAAEADQNESIPSWLANLVAPQEMPAEGSSPVFKESDEELIASAYSEDSSADSAESKETPPASAGDTTLEPATLPPWMHSMRPIESALPENLEAFVNRDQASDTLGDLDDVLPAPIVPTEYSKPPAYEDELTVTDRQRTHAELLQSMLSSEKTPQSTQIKVPPDRSRLAKTIISILFLGIVAAVLFLGVVSAPLPTNYPSGAVSMVSGIKALPEDAFVLVVADFEAAYLGEMKSAAEPVIKHLASKNTRLALLSTNATTPILIQKIVEDAVLDQSSFTTDQKVINLGYIPAGATGLQNFATSAQLTVRYTWDQNLIDPASVLNESLSLNNFDAVLVITGNYETAKLWLEQITPRMGEIPTWMISGQQSAQLISPYLESGQLRGLISGMEGGLLYAQQVGIPQANPSSWSAYQIGVTLALAMIVLGGIIHRLASRPKRQQSKPEEVNNAVG